MVEVAAKLRFDGVAVGDRIPPLSKVVRRGDVKAYADASGDQNPLHQDDAFARSVGFPGIIAHGMFSMAHLTKALTDWAGDPGALKALDVQFRAVVFMDETLVAHGEVTSKDEATRRVKLKVWAEVERAGDRVLPIKNSEAEVELA
jgi:acyl dehydratase